MHSKKTKILSRVITFIWQCCGLDGGAPSPWAGAPAPAAARRARWTAAALPEVETSLRQRS
jgi:hypothetical protein